MRLLNLLKKKKYKQELIKAENDTNIIAQTMNSETNCCLLLEEKEKTNVIFYHELYKFKLNKNDISERIKSYYNSILYDLSLKW